MAILELLHVQIPIGTTSISRASVDRAFKDVGFIDFYAAQLQRDLAAENRCQAARTSALQHRELLTKAGRSARWMVRTATWSVRYDRPRDDARGCASAMRHRVRHGCIWASISKSLSIPRLTVSTERPSQIRSAITHGPIVNSLWVPGTRYSRCLTSCACFRFLTHPHCQLYRYNSV